MGKGGKERKRVENGNKGERGWKRGKWGEGAEKGLEKRGGKDDRRGKEEGDVSEKPVIY